MTSFLASLVKKSPFYYTYRDWNSIKEYESWKKNGGVPVPHIIKQKVLREFKDKFSISTLVETGTFYGDMIKAMKGDFDTIYSIELSEPLYRKARSRFKSDNNVHLLQGDSGKVLEILVPKIEVPALFWLDGHYSGGETAKGESNTPIFNELKHIFNSSINGHVIIVDDARCFGQDPGYPTMEELSAFVLKSKPNATIDSELDSIRITNI